MKFEEIFESCIEKVLQERNRDLTEKIEKLESKLDTIFNPKEDDIDLNFENQEMVRIQGSLPVRQKEWLRTEAFKQNIHVSHFLRILIEKEMRKKDV